MLSYFVDFSVTKYLHTEKVMKGFVSTVVLLAVVIMLLFKFVERTGTILFLRGEVL